MLPLRRKLMDHTSASAQAWIFKAQHSYRVWVCDTTVYAISLNRRAESFTSWNLHKHFSNLTWEFYPVYSKRVNPHSQMLWLRASTWVRAVLSRQNRFPPKIGPTGLILTKKPAKSGPLDHFCCQNQSGRTNFGSQNWSPLPILVPQVDRFWQEVICQNWSPPIYYFLYYTIELSH